MKNIIEEITHNMELNENLEKRWREGADTTELSDMCKKAGVDASAEEIENILAALQDQLAQKISVEKLDLKQLENVTGGTEADYCDLNYACDIAFKNCYFSLNCRANETCEEDAGCDWIAYNNFGRWNNNQKYCYSQWRKQN